MQQDKLQNWLLKHGSQPQISVKVFVIGLSLFLVAAVLIYLGQNILYLQILGLVTMLFAILIAGKGYLGIVSNRIAYFRHQAFKNKEKYKHIK